MARSTIVVMLAVALCHTSSAADTQQRFPERANPYAQYSGCPEQQPGGEHVAAIDFSKPADNELLNAAWDWGVRTIFRYYDWEASDEIWDRRPEMRETRCFRPDGTRFDPRFTRAWRTGESIPGKTLQKDERDRILAKGFALGVVFQHCSDVLPTFEDTERAAFDAKRALQLAAELEQPKNTVIFFGVDFDAGPETFASIEKYVGIANRLITEGGYVLGIYGNGYTCERLKSQVSFCWLSQSTGHRDSKTVATARTWDVKQCQARQPFSGSGVDFDLDILNGDRPPIPFWKKK